MTRPILLVNPDDMALCPECGRRLGMDHTILDEDEDGPIFDGVCAEHGSWKIQIEAEPYE